MSISHWGMFYDVKALSGTIPLTMLAFYYDWAAAEMIEHSQGMS